MAEADDVIQEYSPRYWLQELEREKKQGGEKWRKTGKGVVKRYRDERDDKDAARKFNILYSNIETLKPAVFGRTPVPVVKRRFPGDDGATRIAGEIIEKALTFSLDDYDFDTHAEKARDDGLLPGRGILWVEYEPELVKRRPTREAPQLAPMLPMPGAPPGMAPGLTPAAPGGPAPLPAGPPGGPMQAMMGGMVPPGAPPMPGAMMPGAVPPSGPPPLPRWMLDGAPVEDSDLKYEDDDEAKEKPYVDDLADEHVKACFVLWKDFRHTPVDDWKQVWWVARRRYLTKDEATKEFTAAKAKQLTYAAGNEESDDKDDESGKKPGRTCVWEFWCKRTKKIHIIGEGMKDEALSEKPVPFSVQGFFPCPEPFRPINTTDRWEPIAEYTEYQDQALEIDDYTARIKLMTDAIKAGGVAPDVIASALNSLKGDGTIGVVKDFQSLLEAGGFKDGQGIHWSPIEQFAKVIEILATRRQETMQELFQITGISDLMRQSTMASETATAQQLKGNFGQLRLQPRQKPFERFIRSTMRIMAEVIAEKFSRRTLERMTGVDLGSSGKPEAQQLGEQVMELLRADRLRSYRIDVETDSMILPDEQADKAATVEFVGAITKYLEGAAQIAQLQPAMVPLLAEMLRAACRRFKMGRELEDVVDKTVQQLTEVAQKAATAPPPPNPEVEKERVKAEAEKVKAMEKAKLDAQTAQQDAQLRDTENERAHQRTLQEIAHKATAERQKMADQHALEQQKQQHQHMIEAKKSEDDLAQREHDRSIQQRDFAIKGADSARKGDEHRMKMEDRQSDRQSKERSELRAEESHAAEVTAKSAEKQSHETTGKSAVALAEAAASLVDAVKELKKPRKVKKTGSNEWDIV